jgi:competence protein ComEA
MIMKKKIVITGITVLLFLTAGICYSCSYKNDSASAVLLPAGQESADEVTTKDLPTQAVQAVPTADLQESDQTEVCAHICGAVVHPGVYAVRGGGRLIDLIEAAGGFSEDAAQDYMNQAQAVTDGQRYFIPTEEEVKDLSSAQLIAGDTGSPKEQSESVLVNINTADRETLMSLPGIGESKAAAILSYRKSNGDFKSIEELMNIPGIKEGLFNQVSSYITVN